MSFPRKSGAAFGLALGALALLPATGSAAVSFGSTLTDSPNGSLNSPSAQCAPAESPCTRIGVRFPSQPGDQQEQKAPVDGVVVKFRIRSNTPDEVTFRLARLIEGYTGAQASGAGTGPKVTLKGTGEIEEYAARVPVAAGDVLGIDAAQTTAWYGNSGGKRQYLFGPTLGSAAQSTTVDENDELLVQAVIELDADKDGFGDETQDLCPTNPTAQGECPVAPPMPPVDDVAPGLTDVGQIGNKIAFSLSEAGKVTFKVEKRTAGRMMKSGKCVTKTRRNRKRKTCARHVKFGSFTAGATAGANLVALPTTIGAKRLRRGRYRITLDAIDGAGNGSISVTRTILVK